MPEEPRQFIVPVRRLARMLDISPRRVQQLADEGVLPKTERGRYDVDEAVRSYMWYLKDGEGRTGAGESLESARKRRMIAEADIAELNAAARRGQLVDAAAVDHEARETFITVREQMLQIPDRVISALIGETDERTMKDTLLEEIRMALASLADEGDVATEEEAAG